MTRLGPIAEMDVRIRSVKQAWAWTIGLTTLLLVFAIPLTKMFEPEEPLIDIAIQSIIIGGVLCLPVFGFITYQSLQLNRTRDELADLVNKDRLTNAATRHYFYHKLDKDPDRSGACLMVDVDHFKKINDSFGHMIGDAALAHVAAQIKACLRPDDLICRFGGEEFVVFLPDAFAEEAKEIAERMRKTVADAPEGGAISHPVTVSIGGSTVPAAHDIDAAIRVADDALYQAKRGGRNRVIWAETAPDAFKEALRDAG
ncbi:MAG: GGDEF domain-containing protein [Pseudomonadota bacterium]